MYIHISIHHVLTSTDHAMTKKTVGQRLVNALWQLMDD